MTKGNRFDALAASGDEGAQQDPEHPESRRQGKLTKRGRRRRQPSLSQDEDKAKATQ